jgi:Protein of unknown function (DUF1064)
VSQASKYHNCKTIVHGIQFDSKKEAERYQELLWMEQFGLIHKIELQPKYELVVNDQKIGAYYGDFRYELTETGESITEDVKGMKTPVYQIKKKLVKALYGIEIREV